MTFDSLEKTRARNAAKMIRLGLAQANPGAGIGLIEHWPQMRIKSGIIAGYIPLQTEIDPRPLMQALEDAGHTLALPCIKRKGQPLEFRSYKIGDKLRGGAYGTKEPARTAPLISPDIVLLPLLAYSRIGVRLGYGGGFYDRTLAQLRQKTSGENPIFACALAYSGQEVPILPSGNHDQVLDGVLTEAGFKDFRCA